MNFFVRPKDMKKVFSPDYTEQEKDIVSYVRVNKLKKASIDEKGNIDEDDFIVEEEVVENERVNRDDYINSFREDVGIGNILKKVALSGDVSLFNQVKRVPQPLAADGKEQVIDITPLQEGEEKVAAMGDNMRKTYSRLPDELKAGRSLEQFLEGVSQSEIDAFVSSYVEKKKGENK